MLNRDFWKNRKVFITGNTGFKGSWLCLWLHQLSAKTTGYALKPPTTPNMFELCGIKEVVPTTIADIRDLIALQNAITACEPEVVIHMAAQPLVRESYVYPVETYSTNVMGTVNLLEAVRNCPSVRAVVSITTDKCYENNEWVWGYREQDRLGGYDPYSNSKACAELVTASYRNSFFHPNDYQKHRTAVASARAGNVIGGGDWAKERLIPDCVRALVSGEPVLIRNPNAIRPWQHVLEPLCGYLTLAEKLYEYGPEYGEAWNFGPHDSDTKPVRWIVEKLCSKWGETAGYLVDKGSQPPEAYYLKLDCSKANMKLGWEPKWDLSEALEKVVEWNKSYINKENLMTVALNQISEYSHGK